MEIMFYFSYFFLFLTLLSYFSKKLLVLLVFEALTIFIIYSYCSFFGSSFFSIYISLIFSIFMVLDSVFGICLLISTGRSSSFYNSTFNFI